MPSLFYSCPAAARWTDSSGQAAALLLAMGPAGWVSRSCFRSSSPTPMSSRAQPELRFSTLWLVCRRSSLSSERDSMDAAPAACTGSARACASRHASGLSLEHRGEQQKAGGSSPVLQQCQTRHAGPGSFIAAAAEDHDGLPGAAPAQANADAIACFSVAAIPSSAGSSYPLSAPTLARSPPSPSPIPHPIPLRPPQRATTSLLFPTSCPACPRLRARVLQVIGAARASGRHPARPLTHPSPPAALPGRTHRPSPARPPARTHTQIS